MIHDDLNRQNADLFDPDDNGHDAVSKSVVNPTVISSHGAANDSKMKTLASEKHNEMTIPLTDNALTVLGRRYLKKDKDGNVTEAPIDLFRRVARFIASADTLYDPTVNKEKTEETFFNMMANLEFMPNSPTLMNADRDVGQLYACFVLPIDDSMQSIFEAVKNTALIHKSGGGAGFSLSPPRPPPRRRPPAQG